MRCCAKHPDQVSGGACKRCGMTWCANCLVYPFGPAVPPFCLSCAMVVAGVKSRGLPAMSRKEMRSRRKAERLAAAGATPPIEAEPAPEPDGGPPNDWSKPWWETSDSGAFAPVD
jgi:hypothetical protein